ISRVLKAFKKQAGTDHLIGVLLRIIFNPYIIIGYFSFFKSHITTDLYIVNKVEIRKWGYLPIFGPVNGFSQTCLNGDIGSKPIVDSTRRQPIPSFQTDRDGEVKSSPVSGTSYLLQVIFKAQPRINNQLFFIISFAQQVRCVVLFARFIAIIRTGDSI